MKLDGREGRDDMTRRAKAEHASGFTVLLVDDNPDYLQATRLLLEREGHHVLTATNGAEALSILPAQRVDLLLLDYFMPGMTGEHVLAELRKVDPYMQVILQTGYASEQPPRELLQRLNIQGYYDKTEGPEQLLLWTTVGLKAAVTAQLLARSRHAMTLLASSAVKLHPASAPGDPVDATLAEVSRVLNALLDGPAPHALIALLDTGAELHVRGATGALPVTGRARDVCAPAVFSALERAVHRGEVDLTTCTVFPLNAGSSTLGALYIDQRIDEGHVRDAICVLGNQAALAIQCAHLAERAAVDALTGTQVRSVFERSLVRELRAAFRVGSGIALVLVAVDGLERITATGGRLARDRELQRVALLLAHVCRAEDLVGRYEEDSFGIVFRNTTADGPARMAARLFAALEPGGAARAVEPGGARHVDVRLSVSVGYAAAPAHGFAPGEAPRSMSASYFASVAELLKATAVASLGEVQRAGGNAVRAGALVHWPRL